MVVVVVEEDGDGGEKGGGEGGGVDRWSLHLSVCLPPTWAPELRAWTSALVSLGETSPTSTRRSNST